MKLGLKFPFYAKASLVFIGLFAFVAMLFIAQQILVPIICSVLIAIVLSPIVNFFVRKKINRVLAISVTLALVISIVILIIILLSSQANKFSASFPRLVSNFDQLFHQTQVWVSSTFDISTSKIKEWTNETETEIISVSRSLIGQTLMNIGSVLVVLFLIPVYVFLILFYKPLLVEFIHKLFSTNSLGEVDIVLRATKKIIQSYLVGLLLEACIIVVLYSTSLLILGINYAILLAVIGTILNLIPYIGGVIAVILPMLIALATKSPTYALLVLASYILIQVIDNNFIIPKVVASKVQINALVSIVVVIVGGALWGIPGMFLSIPITAIIKVVFDHIDGLKPWGYLLGNTVPTLPR